MSNTLLLGRRWALVAAGCVALAGVVRLSTPAVAAPPGSSIKAAFSGPYAGDNVTGDGTAVLRITNDRRVSNAPSQIRANITLDQTTYGNLTGTFEPTNRLLVLGRTLGNPRRPSGVVSVGGSFSEDLREFTGQVTYTPSGGMERRYNVTLTRQGR